MEVGNISDINSSRFRDFKSTANNASFSTDRVEISESAIEIDRYVEEVKSLPETRQEVVNEFKLKVNGEGYPPPVIIEGLASLLGSGLVEEK